jgi:uncharacterized RDD family membrane protein YckC
MDQRPPGGSEPRPDAPEPIEPPTPAEPAPMPWERSEAAPADQPRSTIISAEPVLTDQPAAADGPEVAWSPPPPSNVERGVPGAAGFVFAGTPRRFVAWLLDNLLIGLVTIVIAIVIATAANIDVTSTSTTFYSIFSVISVGLSLLYFVLFWTGSRRATPGMAALQLQVGTAFEGRALETGPALIRWALLGYPLSLVSLIPAVGNLVSGLGFIWYLALLVSTIASDTKQGLHDRAASSAVVQPAGLGRSAIVVGCLAIVVGLFLLWILAIGILLTSGEMQEILERSRESIR